MNEYDDILNRIVEEFYDTGRLVLNEERWTDNVSKFYEIIRDANDLYNQRLRHLERNQQKGIDEKLLVIEYLIDLSNRYSNLFEFVDTNMTEDEISRLSRGGEWEWSKFRSPYLSRTDDLKEALRKQRNDYFRKTTEQIINVFNFKEIANIKNVKERLEKYKKLKTLIERLEKIPSYNNYDNKFLNWVNKSISDLEKKLSRLENEWFKKYEKTEKLNNYTSEYINNMKDLYEQFKELSEEEKFLIIDYFKDVRKFSIERTEDKFLSWIDNLIKKYENLLTRGTTEHQGQLTHYLKYKSTITQQDSEKSFDEVVSDIGVIEINDEEFPDILSDYVIDEELLEQRKDILGKIENINSKIKNINDKKEQLKNVGNENWEDEGKTKLPQYENEKKNLEEQLRIIDPIKALFDSDSGWGDNYINCRSKEIENPTNEILEKKLEYSKYLKGYYGTLPKAHKTLLNKHQIDVVNIYGIQIGKKNCNKYNLQNLTKEIDRVSNREDIKNELTSVFTEYNENGVISNLVNKTINLVDNIFKIITDKGIFKKGLLQRYKSYMNMIKIYSQGENQKEKLNQLVYDLNQLKNVVDSYNSLTDKAESPSPSEEDTQEEGAKSLNRDGLRNLLNDISKNSWDKEEIKDYFVKVREHNNVAYEKSFEKKCNGTQYFEKAKGGDNPRIIDITQNNTHLVDYILSADTENKYITTEKIVETVFGEVKSLLNDESAFEKRLKKYDLKVLSDVILTNGNDTITLSPSDKKFIEVKLTKPQDYHFSEFFGVYKSTKSKVYKRMKNLVEGVESDVEENFGRYNGFVDGLVEKLISEEGREIIDIIKSKLQGIFFSNYEFCPIDNIKFSWSTVGQGKEGGREKRVTLRVEPDISKLYTWKEGNPNCDRFKFVGCDKTPGCPQNESTNRIDNIIENFFDTGRLILESRGKRFTNDELRNIALNYETRGEWSKKDKNSYQQAIKRNKEIPGFYEDITSHMIVLNKHLTNDELRNIAKKYETKVEWRKNDLTTYNQAYRRDKKNPGFWEDIASGMETRQQKKYLTDNELRNIAKKYRTKSEWNTNDRNSYVQAYNRDKKIPGFWKDITSHMEIINASKKHIYAYEFYDKENNPIAVYVGLTCDMTRRNKEHQTGYCSFGEEETQVFKFIKENPKLKYEIKLLEPNQYKGKEAEQKEIEWEEKYRHNGWRTLNIAKPGSLGGLYKLTNDELRNIALNYETRGEWRKNDLTTYRMGLRRGKDFYEDITSHMKSSSLTNDELRNIAKKYETKIEWRKNDQNSYAKAYRRDKKNPGFWEDITSHMKSSSLTNDELRNIAKKYETKSEWNTNDRNSYAQAYDRDKKNPGFWEDITSHMGSDDILDRIVEEFFDTGNFDI